MEPNVVINPMLLIISISSIMMISNLAVANPQLNPEIQKICASTKDPAVCVSSVTPYLNGHTDPASVLSMNVFAGIHATEQAIEQAKKALQQPSTKPYEAECLKVCLESYDSALDSWKSALGSIKARNGFDVANHLTAASAMIMSCEDAFTNDDPTVTSNSPLTKIDELLEQIDSNCLDIRVMAFPEN